MNGGQIITRVLQHAGVRNLFTLCGGHIGPIYVEAEKAGMRIWDVRHEATAVFAADAVARLTGVPGVAAVTAGPGVTNAVTAIKNAQMAQSPLLLLGGATATLLRNRGALQDIDQVALLRSAVKYDAQAARVRDLEPILNRALRTAQMGVPGPVFLEFPVDLLYPEKTVREWYGQKNNNAKGLLEKLTQWYINRHVNHLFSGMRSQTSGTQLPDPAQALPGFGAAALEKTLRVLQKAENPVLLLGSGALLSPHLADELAQAVKQLGIPVYCSGMARGLLGRNHPDQFFHYRKKALKEADLIILAGVPVDFRLDYGRHLGRRAVKIALNRNRQELYKNLRPQQAVLADPAAFLIALAGRAPASPGWKNWKDVLQSRDDEREKEIAEMAATEVQGINPLQLFRHLEAHLPENSILIADGGDFAATAAYTMRPRRPLGWLDPGVFGTLGVGGGFALGAAASYPDDYIWIIYGDGSVAYSLAEFETFAKNGLKVCGIVGNNGSWEQIARDQIALLGAETAVSLPRTDYDKVAGGYGAAGERVHTQAEFEKALKNAIASMDRGVPYLINAEIGSTTFRKGSISM
ncbi:MAG: thiamine pyrophosphate-binding protein [Bacteroidetes bacterium]|nr:MAG: thiamine pyrophosphate-binding protein [Bacteroidota bacterium]